MEARHSYQDTGRSLQTPLLAYLMHAKHSERTKHEGAEKREKIQAFASRLIRYPRVREERNAIVAMNQFK